MRSETIQTDRNDLERGPMLPMVLTLGAYAVIGWFMTRGGRDRTEPDAEPLGEPLLDGLSLVAISMTIVTSDTGCGTSDPTSSTDCSTHH